MKNKKASEIRHHFNKEKPHGKAPHSTHWKRNQFSVWDDTLGGSLVLTSSAQRGHFGSTWTFFLADQNSVDQVGPDCVQPLVEEKAHQTFRSNLHVRITGRKQPREWSFRWGQRGTASSDHSEPCRQRLRNPWRILSKEVDVILTCSKDSLYNM